MEARCLLQLAKTQSGQLQMSTPSTHQTSHPNQHCYIFTTTCFPLTNRPDSRLLWSAMNRPRNRQPRPPRQDKQNATRPGPTSRGSPATPQQAAGTVPTVQQVIPGASVFIILKEDQPTGKETAGVVSQLLTRGNHPRGIKVRLRNGQVGRVQRMDTASAATPVVPEYSSRPHAPSRFTHRYTDVRNDVDFPSEPPPRSLADFLPPLPSASQAAPDMSHGSDAVVSYVAVNCPFCDLFTGDEAAVTHHIDREHLS
ncbi:hypothetical protein J3458_008720 [Metarhizium acridum]|uniref:uncharacterized protein n=1 Tax=Metarhizium acridum TaxID=92637 RepID=UPI001C6AB29F|nr:hypothetical protein J3458_008720 [Metarhizium acridum]